MRYGNLATGVVIVLIWLPGCTTSSTGKSNKTSTRATKFPVAEVLRGLHNPKAAERRATIDRLLYDGAKARPVVPALIQMLSNRDPRVVQTAMVALGAVGPAAAPALRPLVKAVRRLRKRPTPSGPGPQSGKPQQAPPRITRHPAPPKHPLDHSFRWGFSWTMKRIGPASVAPLVTALNDRSIGRWVLGALTQMGKGAHTAGPALVARLRQQMVGSANRQIHASSLVHALRTTNNLPRAVTMIRQALGHRDANVRAGAAWACDRLCSADQVSPLLRALKDPDVRVRSHAADALGRFPSRAAEIAPALGRAHSQAQAPAQADPSAGFRTSLMRALGQLAFNARGRKDRQQIIGLVRAPLALGLRDRNAETRTFALHGLGHLGPGASPVLREIMRALSDPQWTVRAAAAQTLGTLGSAAKPAVGALIKAFRDRADTGSKGEDPYAVRVAAMNALVSLGPVALPAVIQTLGQRDRRTVLYAVRCLAKQRQNARAALPALKQLRRKARGTLRGEIDLAIAQIQGAP
jgi:HEAT repeat protein